MQKKVYKLITIIMLSIVFLAVAGYFTVSGYYRSKFLCGTYINGKDMRAMGIEEANDYLVDSYKSGVDYSNVTLVFEGLNGYTESVRGSDISLRADMTKGLDEIMSSQKPYEWLMYAMYPFQYDIKPNVSFDEEALMADIESFECVRKQKAQMNPVVEIRKDKNGYTLYDEIADKPDTDRIFEKALAELDRIDNTVIKVDIRDCYIKHSIPDKYADVVSLFNKIDKVATAGITYEDAPLKYSLEGKQAVQWLETGSDGLPVLDEGGNLVFDSDKLEKYADTLADIFDTTGGTFDWLKQNGEKVTLKNSMQGYKVDKEAEIEKIKETLLRGGNLKRSPIYAEKGKGRGRDAIGKTYIEVDMSAQKLYYYVNGRLKMQSDVVTGNLARGNGTPAKLCDVYFKQRNRTLRGENYATFVSYWMAVSGHIGIHDATWRSKFGGDIYKTAGSHGCVNVPKSFAAQLYEVVEIGTPCIMYY